MSLSIPLLISDIPPLTKAPIAIPPRALMTPAPNAFNPLNADFPKFLKLNDVDFNCASYA